MSTGGFPAVVALGVWYAIGLGRMWARVGRGRLVSPVRAGCFATGVVVLLFALGPPLDTQVDTNLTLHMTQHVLMMWVAAPLLVAGAPFPTLLWALPDNVRPRLQRHWQRLHRRASGDAWPLWVAVALAVQTTALAVWHVPALYQAAVRNDAVHMTEHFVFFGTSVALWWTLAGAVRRARYGAGVLAVFIAKLPGLILGVGMTLDAHIWYPVYGSGAGALHDQQYAGIVMWVAGGMIATVAALVLFASWMTALERLAPNAHVHVPEVPA